MVTTKLNLSMTEPSVRQIYAKQGDTGRVLDIALDQTPEDGTLRILRPDGVEVTSEAVTGGEVESGGTFESLTEADVTELSVGIEPVQDLNGYDHPWVGGAGKNLYNASAIGNLSGNGITATVSNGTITLNGTATANAFFSIHGTGYANQQYTYSLNNPVANSGVHMSFRDTNGNYFNDASANAVNRVITFTNEPSSIILYVTSGTTLSNFVVKPQLELGSTATAWQPYSNICPITGHDEVTVYFGAERGTADETYTTSLGQTVYGGTLDMVTGQLVVDKAMVDLGSLTWRENGAITGGKQYATEIADKKVGETNFICSAFATSFPTTTLGYICGRKATKTVAANSPITTFADFVTSVTGQKIVYELETPQTYTLTAQQIKTLVGTNNVWASSGQIVNIKFTYGGLLSALPSDATSVVGKCYCDVEQNGVSSMPFTLNVKKNERQ